MNSRTVRALARGERAADGDRGRHLRTQVDRGCLHLGMRPKAALGAHESWRDQVSPVLVRRARQPSSPTTLLYTVPK
jgi:hypothetical protein